MRICRPPIARLVPSKERFVNVCGIRWGADRSSWIVLGAHYDVTQGAVEGAYDDGSGTLMVVKIAEALANLETPRTLVACAFDGEERGLRGSRHMVQALAKDEWVHSGTVVAMVDLDMIGINHPADPPMVIDVSSPEMRRVLEALVKTKEIPANKVEWRHIRGGSSDGYSFEAAEIPTAFFISNFDKVKYRGLDWPSTYPFWHRVDTYETMEEMAGGPEKLKGGFQVAMDLATGVVYRLLADASLEPTFHREP
jgi:Zn-dependent M28 family amino/carboxypeptidase